MIKPQIAKIIRKEDLTVEEAKSAMQSIMRGEATPAQIGGYLIALRMKGETVDEITGSAQAMRANSSSVPDVSGGEQLLDTAGTGGDGAHTFNISTAAAFVIAGCGLKVAKHGNRAASSKCGSADVLEALGVEIELEPEQVAASIQEIGFGFFYAPKFHPAMKHAIGPRRELGQRTIFNVLGPLTNPAGASHQLIGVYDPALTEPLAEVLNALGTKAAFVVHGPDGLDEMSTQGPNRVSHLHQNHVTTFELDATKLGLRPASLDELRGGDAVLNAKMMRDLLAGDDQSPRRDVVLLNAAAALATEDGDFERALVRAKTSLDEGKALEKLEQLIVFSRRVSSKEAAE